MYHKARCEPRTHWCGCLSDSEALNVSEQMITAGDIVTLILSDKWKVPGHALIHCNSCSWCHTATV